MRIQAENTASVAAETVEAKAQLQVALARISELENEKLAFVSAYMKAGGELGTMQHRIARQRRTLAKLYQHRHEKNKTQAARIAELEAALLTAKQELSANDLQRAFIEIRVALAGGKKDE